MVKFTEQEKRWEGRRIAKEKKKEIKEWNKGLKKGKKEENY